MSLRNSLFELLWEHSDDGHEKEVLFDDVYNDVPEDLKNIRVKVVEFYTYPYDKKKAIMAWLAGEVDTK